MENMDYNYKLGRRFEVARRRSGKTKKETVEAIGDCFTDEEGHSEAGFSYDNCRKMLTNVEKGIFMIHGDSQHRQRRFMHQLSMFYHDVSLEDEYCSAICPIGKERTQIACKDLNEVTSRLSDSFELLQENAGKIMKRIEDGQLTKEEWPEMLADAQILEEASALSKAVRRLNEIRPVRSGHAKVQSDIPYRSGRVDFGLKSQSEAEDIVWIARSTLSEIESGTRVPSQEQVITMSRAYLSPRIRNFYCYHDCPIGGRMEPLDVSDFKGVSLMLASTLFYIGDLNRQLVKSFSKDNPNTEDIRSLVEELTEFSNRADSMRLQLAEQLCGKLRFMLQDGKITKEEKADFKETLCNLEKLGDTISVEYIEDLKTRYL